MSDCNTTPLPTFLIIGAQKSATRWLRLNLGEHPEVFTAGGEPSFFSRHFDHGLDWYRATFDGWSGEQIVGEATPAYMMWRRDLDRIPLRIEKSLPDVRLMALLRNPVDRAYSAFIHHMRRGRVPPDADLLEWVRSLSPENDALRLVAGGWYAGSLAPYFARFGERLRVFVHDDAAQDPEGLFAQALEHIGASPGFVPAKLRRIRYSNEPPVTSSYTEEGKNRRELSPTERVELYTYFRGDVERLEELLGRDLSIWRPA